MVYFLSYFYFVRSVSKVLSLSTKLASVKCMFMCFYIMRSWIRWWLNKDLKYGVELLGTYWREEYSRKRNHHQKDSNVCGAEGTVKRMVGQKTRKKKVVEIRSEVGRIWSHRAEENCKDFGFDCGYKGEPLKDFQ